MSLWFLPILLLGVALLTYGGVMYAFGKRRNVGLIFGAAGVLMGLSAPIGVLIGDGAPAVTTSAPTVPSSAVAFTYPKPGEALDAQDYLLEGTGPSGETLEITRNAEALGSVTIGANNTWAYLVPAPTAGEYEYEIKGSSGSAKLNLSVQEGLTTASNAQCPCRLRITNDINQQNITDATVLLFKDGTEIARGTAPFIFSDLSAGEYTYALEAPGYVTSEPAPASLPKNKNLSAYLEPQR